MHRGEWRLRGERDTICPGCLGPYPQRSGPIHAYVAASSECWGLFTEVSRHVPERLFTDAYMTQHPDGDDPRQVQSVAVHLIALEAVLNRQQPRSKVEDILRAGIRVSQRMGGYPRLDRPTNWPWTIIDVVEDSVTGTQYVETVHESWRHNEAHRLEEWTSWTLEALYG